MQSLDMYLKNTSRSEPEIADSQILVDCSRHVDIPLYAWSLGIEGSSFWNTAKTKTTFVSNQMNNLDSCAVMRGWNKSILNTTKYQIYLKQ